MQVSPTSEWYLKPRQRAQVCLRSDHRTRAAWDLCRVFTRELNPCSNIHLGPQVFKKFVSREDERLWRKLKRRGHDPKAIEAAYREKLYGPPPPALTSEEYLKFHGVSVPEIDNLPGF